jgi:hypothetical protein
VNRWCGTTDAYCLVANGCLSGCTNAAPVAASAALVTTDGSCGATNGGTVCGNWATGPCCSQWGWCGNRYYNSSLLSDSCLNPITAPITAESVAKTGPAWDLLPSSLHQVLSQQLQLRPHSKSPPTAHAVPRVVSFAETGQTAVVVLRMDGAAIRMHYYHYLLHQTLANRRIGPLTVEIAVSPVRV